MNQKPNKNPNKNPKQQIKDAFSHGKKLVEKHNKDMFVAKMAANGYTCTPEFLFHETRKWRIDFYIEHNGKKLAIEVEGGIWSNGRHTRGSGFINDMQKYNELTKYGIFLYRVEPSKLFNLSVLEDIQTILGT